MSTILYIIGILSKSKGQILRTDAVLNVLFEIDNEEHDSSEISLKAMCAAIDYMQTSVQHTAYIAGKNTSKNGYGIIIHTYIFT